MRSRLNQKSQSRFGSAHGTSEHSWAPGSQSFLAETLRAYSIDIACLQETRIPDEGHTLLSARNPETPETLIPPTSFSTPAQPTILGTTV